jgi:NADH:ubiquinone oxidoreductase subunit 3 (subunit A)
LFDKGSSDRPMPIKCVAREVSLFIFVALLLVISMVVASAFLSKKRHDKSKLMDRLDLKFKDFII